MDTRALADAFTDRMGNLQIALDSLLSNVQQGCIERDANEEKLTKLYQALDRGDLEQVTQLVQENGAKSFINRRLGVRQVGFNTHHMQITPLALCCMSGKTDMAKILIDGGSDVNMTYGSLNATALMTSSHLGDADMLDVLLAAGADPCVRDTQGCNSLTYAATGKCSFKVIRKLVEAHVDLNCKNPFGFTALHVTCGMGMDEAVSVLLSSGADPNVTTDFGHTPLHLAVTGKKERMDQINKLGYTQSLDEPVVQDIAEHGLQQWAKIRQLDIGVNLPKRKQPNVKYNLNANPKTKDQVNRNSEVFYGSEDDDETDAVPMRAKLSPLSRDGKQRISDGKAPPRSTGSTSSLFSCASGRSRRRSRSEDAKNKEKRRSKVMDIENYLLGNDTDVTHASEEALELAKKYANAVKMLLASSCDVNIVDAYNWTALDYAVLSEDEELKTVLTNAGGDPLRAVKQFALTDLYFAIKAENKKDIKALIKDGFDLNACFHHEMVHALDDSDEEHDVTTRSHENVDVGLTPLTLTARMDNNDLVKLMLKSGAKVNQASKNGEFPLAEATINGNLKTVECLLKAGADVNMQTTAYNGAVTLMLAVRHKHRKITELLVKKGAKVECVNTDGKSAFSLAVEMGDQRVAELLRAHTTSHIGKDLASLKQWYDKQCPKTDPYAGVYCDEPGVVPRSSSNMFMRTNWYPKAQRPRSVIEPMVSDLLQSRFNAHEGIMIPEKPRERTRSCDLTISPPAEKLNNLSRRNFSQSGDVDASDDFIRTSQPDIVKTTVPPTKSIALSPTDAFIGDMSVIQEVSFEYETDTQYNHNESKPENKVSGGEITIPSTDVLEQRHVNPVDSNDSVISEQDSFQVNPSKEPEYSNVPSELALNLPSHQTEPITLSTASTLESPDRLSSPEMLPMMSQSQPITENIDRQGPNKAMSEETGHVQNEPMISDSLLERDTIEEHNHLDGQNTEVKSPYSYKQVENECDSYVNDEQILNSRISPLVVVTHTNEERDGTEKPTFASLEDFLHSGIVPEYDGSTYDRTLQKKLAYGHALDEDEANHGDDEGSTTDWTAYDSDFIPDKPIMNAEEFAVLMKNKDNDRLNMQSKTVPPRQSGIETTV